MPLPRGLPEWLGKTGATQRVRNVSSAIENILRDFIMNGILVYMVKEASIAWIVTKQTERIKMGSGIKDN
jgi:hypothetical protein